MAQGELTRNQDVNEYSRLLHNDSVEQGQDHDDPNSLISSHVSKNELALGGTTVGERLPYNDYTSVDLLHDLVRSVLDFMLAICLLTLHR